MVMSNADEIGAGEGIAEKDYAEMKIEDIQIDDVGANEQIDDVGAKEQIDDVGANEDLCQKTTTSFRSGIQKDT